MARPDPMQVYVATVNPIMSGDPALYLSRELTQLQAVLKSTQAMIPQAASVAPDGPKDGMQRLARAPWRPVAGQTADAWVYYDGSTSTWRFLPATT